MMINLILDTQTWIYLANGYNQISSKYEDEQHIRLYRILKDLILSKKINILTNEVIIDEWHRNKKAIKLLVEKNWTRLEEYEKIINIIKKTLSDDGKANADLMLKEYRSIVLSEISNNEQHIKNVEQLLLIHSINIPISNDVRIVTTKIGQRKGAPFHNKNNSVGDALILLSIVEYLKNGVKKNISNTVKSIFISNNSDDFCERKGSLNIHPDLLFYFEEVSLKFETNIGRALDLSQEIINKIDEFNLMADRFSYCLANCKDSESSKNAVNYNYEKKIKKDGVEIENFNPHQLSFDLGKKNILTEEKFNLINANKYAYLKFGHCSFCNTQHLRCSCGNEHIISNFDKYIIHCLCGFILKKHKEVYAVYDTRKL